VDSIRVLIVDEDDLFRRGLAMMLGKDSEVEVVGQARSGQEAVRLCAEARPAVVLVEQRLPDMSGGQAARAFARECPDARVAMIARSFAPSELVDAARAGVQGYVTKDITLPALVEAVKLVGRGEPYFSPVAARMMIEELALSGGNNRAPAVVPRSPERAKVTERERDVLRLIVQGATNRDIAARLMITENTVKVHLRNILDKLHLRNRQQAAAFAVSSGLVELQQNNGSHRGDGGGQKPTTTTWRQRSGA
jgi:DNA-binding NarL/FixJ family response regulator